MSFSGIEARGASTMVVIGAFNRTFAGLEETVRGIYRGQILGLANEEALRLINGYRQTRAGMLELTGYYRSELPNRRSKYTYPLKFPARFSPGNGQGEHVIGAEPIAVTAQLWLADKLLRDLEPIKNFHRIFGLNFDTPLRHRLQADKAILRARTCSYWDYLGSQEIDVDHIREDRISLEAHIRYSRGYRATNHLDQGNNEYYWSAAEDDLDHRQVLNLA